MLTRDSALFYWDVRYGLHPIVGGEPSFTRDGGASFLDRKGAYRRVVKDVARFEWSADARRPLLRLEPARTTFIRSSEFNVWSNVNTDVSTGQRDPRGGTNAALLTEDVVGGHIAHGQTGLNGGWASLGLNIKHHTSPDIYFGLYSGTVGWRGLLRSIFQDPDPPTFVIAGGGGNGFDLNDVYPPLRLTEGWWRVRFRLATAQSGDVFYIYYPGGGMAGLSTYVHGAMLENGAEPTSPIEAVGGAFGSRAVEQLYWANPQRLIAGEGWVSYLRFHPGIDSVLAPGGNIYFLTWGANTLAPLATLHQPVGNADTLALYYHNGTDAANAVVISSFKPGQLVECAMKIGGDGKVQLIVRVDGGAPVHAASTPASGMHAEGWSQDRLYLNDAGVGSGVEPNVYERLVTIRASHLAATFDGTANVEVLDELAAYQLGPSGELLRAA